MNTECLLLKSVKLFSLLLFSLCSSFNASSQTVYKSEINELEYPVISDQDLQEK